MAKSKQTHELEISAVDKTKAAFQSIIGSMKSVTGSINSAKGAMAGFGIVLSTGSFGALVKGALDSIGALKKLQQQTGLSAEAISGLNYATNGDTDSIVEMFNKLAKSSYEASKGNDTARAAYDALGISVTDASGKLKSGEQLFNEISLATSKMADGFEKNAILQPLMGENAAKMIPLLNKAAGSITNLSDAAKKYGVDLSGDIINSAAQFGAETKKISQLLDGSATIMAARLAPGLALIANAFHNVLEEETELAKKNDVLKDSTTSWADTAVTVISYVLDGFTLVKRSVEFIGIKLGTFVAGFVTVVGMLYESLYALGEAQRMIFKGDFAGAKARMQTLGKDWDETLTGMIEAQQSADDQITALYAADKPGEAMRRNYGKAKDARDKALADDANKRQGVLTAEQSFNNQMDTLRRAAARGMQEQIAKQIEALDKYQSKLKEARDRQKNVAEDFQKVRDEMQFGSTARPDDKVADQIRDALKAAEKAKAAGKYDIADAESRKALGMIKADNDKGEASFDDKWGGKRLYGFEKEQYLQQAQKIAQEAADANVKAQEDNVKKAQATIDTLVAKAQALSKLKIGVDEEAAIKTVDNLLTKLQAAIKDKPLEIATRFVNGTETESMGKAGAMLPSELRTSGVSAAMPQAAAVRPATASPVASAQNNAAPVLLDFGQGVRAPATATPEQIQGLIAARDKLKAGN